MLVMMVQQALTVLCLDVADGDDKKQEGEDCDCRSSLQHAQGQNRKAGEPVGGTLC